MEFRLVADKDGQTDTGVAQVYYRFNKSTKGTQHQKASPSVLLQVEIFIQ